ncbi:methyltransferase family protein [Psychromonas sp. L1A2]|uniref:methyltransferase family protein n=1 Tax=Psychromonas sp. L1A2 TaxID=2686356 RepID=UPI0013592F21|nr:isoprenylcysteine carboxylmethyltransferase family protein [Psychromonas sp. L1A2]
MTFYGNQLDITEFTRFYLAAFYTFVAVFYTVKVLVNKRQINRQSSNQASIQLSTRNDSQHNTQNGSQNDHLDNNQQEVIFTGERFCSTWWNHMTFRVFRATIWMVCLARLFLPNVDNYLGMLFFSESFSIVLLGNILLTLGFMMTVIIHFKMGKQWRSGIDPSGPKKLITDGFYKFSRNPMFLSIALSQFAFFLALPSLFSLLCFIIGVMALYRQILSEETHLLQHFPEQYNIYSTKVRRWL